MDAVWMMYGSVWMLVSVHPSPSLLRRSLVYLFPVTGLAQQLCSGS